MKRRALLASLGAAGGTLGTAGCLQGTGSPTTTTDAPGDTTTEPSATRSDTTTRESSTTENSTTDRERTDDGTEQPPDGEFDPAGDPVATLSVNDRSELSFPDANRPHSLALWNAVDRERDVRVEWVDGRTDELERSDAVTVPADGLLQVDLQVPTRYVVTVRADDAALGEVRVDRGQFDCNASAGRYALRESDLEDYGVVSTAAGCPAPTVAEASLTAGDGDCGSRDGETAVAGYGDRAVTVEGTVPAPDPCHDLAIADVSYDGKTRTARVVVEATTNDEGCVQCVGAIDYTATIRYDHDFPDRVEVYHRSWDEDRRVATTTWNDDI
ncbi:hypothetical protein [Halorubellus sp. PRR65]|uniref:hypothetical protein n=1 Tax=Halorubellus sp. PRR65 TaxID=3098148 RepID=UPI002B259BAC|nr:hypothetical protein [Halorubellus sp. PRR65]